MSKENISATVDPAVKEYLKRDDVNASGLVNKLVKQHMNGGAGEEWMFKFRMKQVESELSDLQGRLENKRNEYSQLEEQWKERQSEKEEVLDKAANALSKSDLEERNRKVQFWAGEADMTVDELTGALEGRVE